MRLSPGWAVVLALSAVSLRAFENKAVISVDIAGPHPAVDLETKAGEPLDPARIEHDVKRLWAAGRFEDVRVESVEEPEGVHVTFHVTAKPALRLRKVEIKPPLPGITAGVPEGRPLDDAVAQKLAAEVRGQLISKGYPEATARAEIVPVGPGQADVRVTTHEGAHSRIEGVRSSGDLAAKPGELRKALQATRTKTMFPGIPGLWQGWKLRPDYSDDAVQADAANLRDFYYKRGYFDANVMVDSVSRGGRSAQVSYSIQAGPRFTVRSVSLEGASGPRDLCRALLSERREAERAGVMDFNARIEVRDAPGGPGVHAADILATTERGPVYRVGRIEIRGNRAFSDIAIRRALRLEEGRPLDETLLRKTLARLNRTNLLEPLTPNEVLVNTPPGADTADIVLRLKERKRGHWYLSGPVGPMSVAGPFQFAIGSRLPSWGRNVFELSTYTASLSLMAFAQPMAAFLPFLPKKQFVVLATLQRPQLPGQRFLSGFSIAPQLGWQGVAAGYGVSQVRDVLTNLLQSERDLTPPLAVTVSRPGRPDGVMNCELPKTVLDRFRQVGTAGVNLLFAFSPL